MYINLHVVSLLLFFNVVELKYFTSVFE